MEKRLSRVGSLLHGLRFTMLFFHVGQVAIISISGVHALKTSLSGDLSLDNIQVITMVAVIRFTFGLPAAP